MWLLSGWSVLSHRAEEACLMHIRWIAPAVALLLIFSALAGQAAAETAVVAGKGVNVRSGPGMGYEVTDTLARGTVVEITAHTGSVWVAVRYPGGSGYMSSDYLEIAGPDLYLDTGNTQAVYGSQEEEIFLDDSVAAAPAVTSTPAPVPTVVPTYPGASAPTPAPIWSAAPSPVQTTQPSIAPTSVPTPMPSTAPTSTLTPIPTIRPAPTASPLPTPLPMPSGSPYPLATLSPEETPIPAAQQMVISSSSSGTTATPGSPAAAQTVATGMDVVEFACRFLGSKYTWAGKDPSTGFDCSGFVWYVYSQFGHDLNRVAASQAKNGFHVDSSDLRMGDILCFYTYGSYIGHSGIYIGNGKFIHAANSSSGVIITELSKYPCNGFEARRILT